jgi:hypothetical protein
MIFFGQFVDHDVTLDASSTFDTVVDDPGEIADVRTPTLDLDCIYGLAPEAQPYLYVQDEPFRGVKLLTGADNPGQDGLQDDDLLRAPTRGTNGSMNEGEGLGPVGATIFAEVIIGLLELDDHSYLGANRNWSPREEWNTLGKLVTVAQP